MGPQKKAAVSTDERRLPTDSNRRYAEHGALAACPVGKNNRRINHTWTTIDATYWKRILLPDLYTTVLTLQRPSGLSQALDSLSKATSVVGF